MDEACLPSNKPWWAGARQPGVHLWLWLWVEEHLPGSWFSGCRGKGMIPPLPSAQNVAPPKSLSSLGARSHHTRLSEHSASPVPCSSLLILRLARLCLLDPASMFLQCHMEVISLPLWWPLALLVHIMSNGVYLLGWTPRSSCFLSGYWFLSPSRVSVPQGSVLRLLFSLSTCLRRHYPFQWLWVGIYVRVTSPLCFPVRCLFWGLRVSIGISNSECLKRNSGCPYHLYLSNCTVVYPAACARYLEVSLTLPLSFTLSHVWTLNRFCWFYLLNIISVLPLFPISTTTMIQTTPASSWMNTVASVSVRMELGYISHKPLK